MLLKRLQKTSSNIKTISAALLKLLKESSHSVTVSNRRCMSLHRQRYVAQSDLHKTVFYSTFTHYMRETKQSHQELSGPLQKGGKRQPPDTQEKNTSPTAGICQQQAFKMRLQHLQTHC